MDENRDWAMALVARRAMVLHVPTQTIGAAVRFFAKGAYISPINQLPVDEAVVELLGGNAFVAKHESVFIELSEAEIQYHGIVSAQIAGVLRMLTQRDSLMGASPQAASVMIIATLSSNVKVMIAAHEKRFGKFGGEGDAG